MHSNPLAERRRVFVIEDDSELRDLLTMILHDENYAVEAFPNGRPALTRLLEQRPDLILLDLMMPEMDGWAFRAAQRSLDGKADVPVVVMSAGADIRAAARTLGAADALSKPFELDDLCIMLRRLLG